MTYRVAHTLFNDPLPLEESIAHHDGRGERSGMDNIQASYFENGGTFLVMTDNDEIICTGAIRRYADGICELKRLWLLQEHQGKGPGYRMSQELFTFARGTGYQHIRLETHPTYQKRAVNFYKRLGFQEISTANTTYDEDILMEMI